MNLALKTQLSPATKMAVAEAAATLRAGGLVAFPTETVYGLGADATDAAAVARLFAAKGRPAFNPLIVHVGSAAQAHVHADFNAAAETLAHRFWPGPLTLVLPKRTDCRIADLVSAGLDTLAIRMPDHPVARGLLDAFGGPIAAPSANRSGHVSPTAAAHVMADLNGRIDVVLDGGATPVGVESTIVAPAGDRPVLLRSGGIAREDIEKALGCRLADPPASAEPSIQAPGMMTSHYAPHARVRRDAERIEPGEAALLFGPAAPRDVERAAVMLNLSPRGDLVEAAANLFSFLRKLDGSGVTTIAVAPIPQHGLGEAINDRLARAAAER
jgi:L-threonylcarbamoyladenylate synthase